VEPIVRPSIVLLIICIVISASLSLTYALTKDRIAESDLLEANNARAELLPGAEFEKIFELSAEEIAQSKVFPIITEIYSATIVNGDERNPAGFVATAIAQGYGGSLQVIVGVSADQKISGIRLTTHSETPGLGAKASEPEFLEQFAGKDASAALAVVKSAASGGDYDIAAISGATITTNAVTQAVNAAVSAIAAHR